MNNLPNQDPETLIHFGCIPARELINYAQTFYDEAEDTRFADGVHEIKTTIGELSELVDDETRAEMIELATENYSENYESEGAPLELNRDDVLILQGNGDETDIFVIKSLYYCFAPPCSPCAPGAGYLMDADKKKGGRHHPFKTYCLDSSWFKGGKAPYKYYEVISDEAVN